MVKIKDLEEKKLIISYFLSRSKGRGIETVYRQWCKWWKEDFTTEGGVLKMYNHSFVLSKTKARQGVEQPAYCKEYYERLNEIFEYVRDSYDKSKNKKENVDILKARLFRYREQCNKNIRQIIAENNLYGKECKFLNQTSKKHPNILGKYVFIHKVNGSKVVKVGSYEDIINYLKQITKGEKLNNE